MQRHRTLPAGAKISAAFAAMFLLSMLIGAVSWISSLRLARDLNSLTGIAHPCYAYMAAVYAAQNEIQASLNGLALQRDPERRRDLRDDIDKRFAKAERDMRAYDELPHGVEEERRWQALRGDLATWFETARLQRALEAERDRAPARANEPDFTARTVEGLQRLRESDYVVDAAFDRLVEQMNVDAEEYRVEAVASIALVKRAIAAAVLLCGLLTAGLAFTTTGTARKDEALRHMEMEKAAFERTLLETLHDAVIGVDAQFIIRSWNKAAERLYGWIAEEVVGRRVSDVLGAEGAVGLGEEFRELDTISRIRVELVQRRKDGAQVQIESDASALHDASERITGYLFANRDVTQLNIAKEAQAASRAKSAFLANMSHEIRTPLNAILGYSELMVRDGTLSTAARQKLEVINHSGEHLLALINDVLEMSKIEAGRATLNSVTFDLHAMVRDVEAMFRQRANAKGVAFEVVGPDGVPPLVEADEGKVRQVLVNLLGNAVKFTREGRVLLRVAAEHSATGRLRVMVSVEDTGAGIAPSEMGKLFQYFSQTESGRRSQMGTGLGLAISREHAHVMGGDIHVTSEVGKGSVFRFEFWANEGRVDARAPRLAAGRVVGIKSCPTPPRVLVADDQETNRGWLRELLSGIGFDVMEAMDGREAVELWRKWKPELVLMDVHMPVMDGHEAMRAIRREPQGDQVALIAISASVLEEDRQDVLRSGADAFVGKPVREGDLLSKIQVLLGLEYLHREDAPPVTTGAVTARGEALGPEALTQWPPGTLRAMREASERADIHRLRRLIADSAHSNESAASELLALVNCYDYEGLNRALGGSRARDEKS